MDHIYITFDVSASSLVRDFYILLCVLYSAYVHMYIILNFLLTNCTIILRYLLYICRMYHVIFLNQMYHIIIFNVMTSY